VDEVFLFGRSESDIPVEEIKNQIFGYINETTTSFLKAAIGKNQHIVSKVLSVSRGFSMLSLDNIGQIYNNSKNLFNSNPDDLEAFKTVFFDILQNSGTSTALDFIIQAIKEDEMSESQIGSFFTWLPTHLRYPNQEIRMKLFLLVTSDKIMKNDFLRKKSMLGFSSLLHKVCIEKNREFSYPTNVFGKACDPGDEFLNSVWIPFLTNQDENEAILSLGFFPTKMSTNHLKKISLDETQTSITKFLAIVSLGNIVEESRSEETSSFLLTFIKSSKEEVSLRIAAFNAIMRSQPSMLILNRLATLTWSLGDKEEDLLSVIRNEFSILSTADPDPRSDKKFSELRKNAALVYPMMKKGIQGQCSISSNAYQTNWMEKLGVVINSMSSWTLENCHESLPQDFLSKLDIKMGGVSFQPISGGFKIADLDKMIDTFKNTFQQDSVLKSTDQALNKMQANGGLFYQIFQSAPNFVSLRGSDLRNFLKIISNSEKASKANICGNSKINYMRAMDRAPNIRIIASDLGVPIVTEVHLPTAVSVVNNLNVDCQDIMPKFNLDTKLVVNAMVIIANIIFKYEV